MKTIHVEAEVSYFVSFDCNVEVPDDFTPDQISNHKLGLGEKIRQQIVEAAAEYDSLMEVDDVDWYIK